ncbi:MAG: hypothetical protein WC867_06420 [Candidatus Pacearchaeota archaeon]|jgi:hypothetical protein
MHTISLGEINSLVRSSFGILASGDYERLDKVNGHSKNPSIISGKELKFIAKPTLLGFIKPSSILEPSNYILYGKFSIYNGSGLFVLEKYKQNAERYLHKYSRRYHIRPDIILLKNIEDLFDISD